MVQYPDYDSLVTSLPTVDKVLDDHASELGHDLYFPAELELLCLSAGFEIAQQYGDYRFVRVDRTSPYVVTVARRPRRSRLRPYWRASCSEFAPMLSRRSNGSP